MSDNKLMDRFKMEMDKRKFNLFEIQGFRSRPDLAILAGMAIGYSLALDDAEHHIEAVKGDSDE